MKIFNNSVFFCICVICYIANAAWLLIVDKDWFWLYAIVLFVITFLVTVVVSFIRYETTILQYNTFWDVLKNDFVFVIAIETLFIFALRVIAQYSI